MCRWRKEGLELGLRELKAEVMLIVTDTQSMIHY